MGLNGATPEMPAGVLVRNKLPQPGSEAKRVVRDQLAVEKVLSEGLQRIRLKHDQQVPEWAGERRIRVD